MRTRRWIGLTLMTLGVLLVLCLTVHDLRDFILRDNGIEFYREESWLLAVCVGIGIVGATMAYLIQLVASHLKQKR